MAITVKRVVEVNVEMTLSEHEAKTLLHFLKNAHDVPKVHIGVPHCDIVRRLANALEDKGV